jgi:hypothetical protein
MNKNTKFHKRTLAGLAHISRRLRPYKIASLISSIVTSGVVFKVSSSDELLRIAATMENRCFGSALDAATQFLILGQSTTGQALAAYVLSASVAGSYLWRHELSEARELGTTLFATVVIIGLALALHVRMATAIWTCIP